MAGRGYTVKKKKNNDSGETLSILASKNGDTKKAELSGPSADNGKSNAAEGSSQNSSSVSQGHITHGI